MVSSGYGVEATVESMFAEAWDSTQFGHFNVLIGTRFNAWIQGPKLSGTDITDPGIVELLKNETHAFFLFFTMMIKQQAVTDPWQFISVWIEENLSGDLFYNRFQLLIDMCAKALGDTETIEVIDIAGFGATNSI